MCHVRKQDPILPNDSFILNGWMLLEQTTDLKDNWFGSGFFI